MKKQCDCVSNSTFTSYKCLDLGKTKRSEKDFVVGSLASVFAIALCINLWRCFSEDWIRDKNIRWKIIVLGLALLFDSACVCIYVYRRNKSPSLRGQSRTLRPNNSQLALVLPQLVLSSYASLELPPSYDSLFVVNEKQSLVDPVRIPVTNTG